MAVRQAAADRSGRPARRLAGGRRARLRDRPAQRGAAPEQAFLVPPGWFEAWAEATLATDPDAPRAGTIRAPAGAVADVRLHWNAGRPLYDPAAITRPVLIVRGEWDIDVTLEMVRDLSGKLTAAPVRRWIEIGAATHMILLERNRWQALEAVTGFLQSKKQGPA